MDQSVWASQKALRAFFRWLSQEPGYSRRIRATDADYFSPTRRDDRIARSAEQRPSPSPEQVRHVLTRMPGETALQKRDRAILAFLILTGIRDGAAIGLKLRHVDLADCMIRQDARDIRTKFSMTMHTWYFPVGENIEVILAERVSAVSKFHCVSCCSESSLNQLALQGSPSRHVAACITPSHNLWYA